MNQIDTLPRPRIPGPLLAAEYWFRPARFLDRCEKLGDRFVLSMPGVPPLVCVTSPADVKAAFTGDQTALHFGEGLKMMAPHEIVLGRTSITIKDDEEHLRDRRMQAPHFVGGKLDAYVPTIAEKTREAMCTWPVGPRVSFQSLMMELTLDVIIATVFGVSDPARHDRVRRSVLDLLGVVGGPSFLVSTIVATARGGRWEGRYPRLQAAKTAVDDLVREEITERRERSDLDRKDILAVFLRMQTENPDAMTDEAIFDAMRTLLIGGYETTASSLAWVAERITRHRQVLERLDESSGQDRDDYLDAVIAESMRLRPVAPFTMRLVVKPFVLDDLQLEPGVMLMPFITLAQRRADTYPEPLAFRPERFEAEPPGTFTWIPFGGGIRRCLGGPFAMLEMRVVLRTILEELRFEPTDEPDEPLARRNVTIVPGGGARVRLRRTATPRVRAAHPASRSSRSTVGAR